MDWKRYLLVLGGLAMSLVLVTGASRADIVEGYCCVCTSCESGDLRVCIPLTAPGGAGAQIECLAQCANEGCQLQNTADGRCALVAACDPEPAPTTSHAGLLALAAGLGGGGFYLARRRRAARR